MPDAASRRTIAAALASLVALLAGASPALAVRDGQPAGARPDLDVRSGERASVPTEVADARAALAKRFAGRGTVSVDPVTGGVRMIGRTDGFLTGAAGGDPAQVALAYARSHLDVLGLDGADLAGLSLVARYRSPDGVTHLTWAQTVDGVPAFDSELSANVTADGRVVNVGGAPVHDLAPPGTDPPLGPAAARSAAQAAVGTTPDGDPGTIGSGPQRPTTFAGGDRAELTVVADPAGDRLAWKVLVAGRSPYLYEVLVDAGSGGIIARHDLTEFAASNASVYDYHPGAAVGGTPHTVDLSGWLGGVTTKLDGLYAHAYADLNSPDGIGGDSEQAPSSGTDFTWALAGVTPAGGQACPTAFSTPCTWDGSSRSSAAANRARVVTQLFYDVSRYHDWLAQAPIGFTAASHDFEKAGGDAVLAESDDSSGLNNANMSTPPDGSPPRMQMYLFDTPFPAVDGGDDASVVFHEYTHGLSNRLVGNGTADGLDDRQSQAMGEGWSDWYALDFLVDQGDVADGPGDGDVVVGAYVTDNTTTGIRDNALDCPVGSSSPSCPGSTTAGPGGFTFADLGRVANDDATHPYFEVHADGEIWSETLWDLRAALGASVTRGLVTDAMRLSPKQPSFLDMRDAILQADLVGGGTHLAQIWQVFANRGMGYGASTASANATRGVASFAVPPLLAAGVPDLAATQPGAAATMSVPLVNPGGQPLTGVQATLSSATPGVTVTQPSASYGTIAAHGTASAGQPFVVTAADTVPCGTLAALSLQVSSDQGSATLPVTVPVGTGRATATKTEGPLNIPDGQPVPGVSSLLNVGSHGRIDRLRVVLRANHTYVGDLHLWLTSPSGTTVDLMENPGDVDPAPSNLVSSSPLTFDDAAPADIQDLDSGSGMNSTTLGGSYRPNEPLSRFAGEDRYGTWTLRASDIWSSDAGSIASWSLETDDPSCAISDAPAVGGSTVTLAGRVDPGQSTTIAAFDYGPTTAYGSRTAGTGLTPGGGLQAHTATLTGLTPGATYHVRSVALRGGAVVAAGADRSFVAPGAPGSTTTTDATPPATTTTTSTTTATVATPATTVPDGGGSTAPLSPAPAPRVAHRPSTLRADARGRLILSFTAAPPGAIGTVTLGASAGRIGTAAFTVRRTGDVVVRITLKRPMLAHLLRRRSLSAKLTVVLGGRTFTSKLTIRAPYRAR